MQVRKNKWVSGTIMTIALSVASGVAVADQPTETGLKEGFHIPAIALKDQSGKPQTFDTLRGPNGLLILFNRSADWCPFCKSQLIDLEVARRHFEGKGIHVVSVTYDSPEILATFAQRRNIHFTMLSDPSSKLIDAFGIRNHDAAGTETGIPIPNYFLIDARGIITKRHAETQLTDRVSASYFYEALFGTGAALPVVATKVPATPHLSVELLQSDSAAAPGTRLNLSLRLTPGKGSHVYAPGSDKMGYHSVKLVLEPSPLYQTGHLVYPKSTIIHFASLGEKVPVFESETVLSQDLWAVRSSETIKQFEQNPNLIIRGTLEYQVCTDSTCFPPAKTPVQWHVTVRPNDLDAVRVPEKLQRK